MFRLLLPLALLASTPAVAQDLSLPIASPAASVTQQVGTATVGVEYFSPAQNGRAVFGELVPYGEVWRTGANDGTVFQTSADLTLAGQPVPAGTYLLFTIPGEDSWTVIVHKDLQARPWAYDAASDLFRVEVEPTEGPNRERLTFLFRDTTEASTTLDLEWAGTRVSLPLAVDTVGHTNAAIDTFVHGAAGRLARAAKFQLEHGAVDKGLALAEQSLALEPSWYALWMKAQLLSKQGEAKAAYKTAQAALAKGNETPSSFWYKAQVEAALASWPKR